MATIPKQFWRIEDRFVDSGIPLEHQPPKTFEGPPYDVAIVNWLLDRLADGYTISEVLADDPTLPRYGEVISYIRHRPELWERYQDAKMTKAELFPEVAQLASQGRDKYGNETMEDVQSRRLAVDTSLKLAGLFNRDLYGERKQIDVTQKIDLRVAMKQAEERLAQRRAEKIIEGEVIPEDVVQMLGLDE